MYQLLQILFFRNPVTQLTLKTKLLFYNTTIFHVINLPFGLISSPGTQEELKAKPL